MEETFAKNKQLNASEIQQRKTLLDSFMMNLIITLSNRCNLRCIMCEVRRVNWEIPQQALAQITHVFPYLETVSWQGGEPFLLEYFDKFFTQAASFKNIKQTIVTNGLLISESWAEKLVSNNVELTFSIDGVTKEVYEHIRKGAAFADVIRSVKLVNQMRKNNLSSKITTRLHVVIMKSNYHQLEEFVDFAKEYEFQALHLMPVQGKVAGVENIFSPPDKDIGCHISAMKKTIEEKAKKYNLLLLNALPFAPLEASCQTNGGPQVSGGVSSGDGQAPHNPEGKDGQPPCLMPWQQLNIDPGGGVRPGCLCLKTVGSILEDRIMDLWNSDAMQSYRKGIIERDFAAICNPACLSVQRSEQLRKQGF